MKKIIIAIALSLTAFVSVAHAESTLWFSENRFITVNEGKDVSYTENGKVRYTCTFSFKDNLKNEFGESYTVDSYDCSAYSLVNITTYKAAPGKLVFTKINGEKRSAGIFKYDEENNWDYMGAVK